TPHPGVRPRARHRPGPRREHGRVRDRRLRRSQGVGVHAHAAAGPSAPDRGDRPPGELRWEAGSADVPSPLPPAPGTLSVARLRVIDLRGADDDVRALLPRPRTAREEAGAAVDETLAAVRDRGDEALRELTERFDGVS